MDAIAKDEEGTGLEVVKFDVTEAIIATTVAKYADIGIKPDDPTSYKTAMKGLAEFRGHRLKIDAGLKFLIKDAQEYIKGAREKAKSLHELNSPGEEALKAKRATEDARVEAIETERVNGIREKITAIERHSYGLKGCSAHELENAYQTLQITPITKEEYHEFQGEAMASLNNVRIAVKEAWDYRLQQDKEATARKAEDERLAVIRKEQDAEAKRLAKLAEEQEEKRIIEEGLKREETEALAKEKQELQAEKDKIAAEKKDIQDKKDREELEKRLAERDQMEAERKAQEAAAHAELDRIQAEKDKARAAELAPDKDNLLAFCEYLEAITPPTMKTEDPAKILFHVMEDIEATTRGLRNAIEKL